MTDLVALEKEMTAAILNVSQKFVQPKAMAR
jgi:hypothetical protein